MLKFWKWLYVNWEWLYVNWARLNDQPQGIQAWLHRLMGVIANILSAEWALSLSAEGEYARHF